MKTARACQSRHNLYFVVIAVIIAAGHMRSVIVWTDGCLQDGASFRAHSGAAREVFDMGPNESVGCREAFDWWRRRILLRNASPSHPRSEGTPPLSALLSALSANFHTTHTRPHYDLDLLPVPLREGTTLVKRIPLHTPTDSIAPQPNG